MVPFGVLHAAAEGNNAIERAESDVCPCDRRLSDLLVPTHSQHFPKRDPHMFMESRTEVRKGVWNVFPVTTCDHYSSSFLEGEIGKKVNRVLSAVAKQDERETSDRHARSASTSTKATGMHSAPKGGPSGR